MISHQTNRLPRVARDNLCLRFTIVSGRHAVVEVCWAMMSPNGKELTCIQEVDHG